MTFKKLVFWSIAAAAVPSSFLSCKLKKAGIWNLKNSLQKEENENILWNAC